MKKIICAISILIIITGFCVYATYHTRTICDETVSFLEESEKLLYLGRQEDAYETLHSAQANWILHENFLGMALRHTESDDVDILFPILKNACLQEDYSEFSYRNKELIANLRHLYRAEYPYIYNIL